MAKDMSHGEIREYNGKKYKYVEQEAMESDINWFDTKCEGCDLKKECAKNYRIDDYLGECYEEYREDGRNGIFEEEKMEKHKVELENISIDDAIEKVRLITDSKTEALK